MRLGHHAAVWIWAAPMPLHVGRVASDRDGDQNADWVASSRSCRNDARRRAPLGRAFRTARHSLSRSLHRRESRQRMARVNDFQKVQSPLVTSARQVTVPATLLRLRTGRSRKTVLYPGEIQKPPLPRTSTQGTGSQ